MGSLTATLSQSFSGIRLIKAYGLEDSESRRSDWLFDEVYRLIMKTVKGRARTQPILEILGGVAISLVLAYGGYRIISGAGTLGEFVGFISAVIMILQPIRSLGNLNASLQEGLAAVKRTFDLLDTESTISEISAAQELKEVSGHLQLSDITFAYELNKPSLKSFSIDIPAGKKIALVGPSGAGKSTVFNLILRFYDPDIGVIKIDGSDIRDLKLDSLRNNIAFVSQDITLFNDSVEANIGFGNPKAGFEEIKAAAKDAAAHTFIKRLSKGYKTVLGEKGVKLSGGERQRIAIARAILKNAPILLFDEATSSLDSQSEKQVHQALGRLTKNRTTIVIAHRLTTVVNSDMIYVIDEGRIVEKGIHTDLISRGGLYSRLANMQFNSQ
jgi:subfamily B ATP-binding cassette protein MsbA